LYQRVISKLKASWRTVKPFDVLSIVDKMPRSGSSMERDLLLLLT
jgi:hypothetical protein